MLPDPRGVGLGLQTRRNEWQDRALRFELERLIASWKRLQNPLCQSKCEEVSYWQPQSLGDSANGFEGKRVSVTRLRRADVCFCGGFARGEVVDRDGFGYADFTASAPAE